MVMLAAVGCGAEKTSPYPELSTLYAAGADVSCPTASNTTIDALTAVCYFENVAIDGGSHCWARVSFARPDTSAPWTVTSVYGSAANCD